METEVTYDKSDRFKKYLRENLSQTFRFRKFSENLDIWILW